MWNEFLPISMPITAIAVCAVAGVACSLSWRPWPAYRWRGRSTAGPSHSDVPSQAHSARFPVSTWTHREVLALMDRAEEKAGPKDVGEQALMRGLDTAFPFFRLGLSWSRIGRRSDDRPHNGFQEFPCRGPAFTPARLMSATIRLILVAMEGAVGRSSAPHDSSGPQPPTTLSLSMCH